MIHNIAISAYTCISARFCILLIALALCKVFHVQETKSFCAWFVVYNVGVIFTIATMLWRGLLQVNGTDFYGFKPYGWIRSCYYKCRARLVYDVAQKSFK